MTTDYRWDDLATYNAERYRGVMHTTETDDRMVLIQAWFDAEQEDRMRDAGGVALPGGGYLLVPGELTLRDVRRLRRRWMRSGRPWWRRWSR